MTDLSRQLAEWSAAEAAGQRARERSLRQQLLESATVAGLLVDMAEWGENVAVTLRGGAGTRTGVIRAVGADFFLIDRTFVPFSAVAVVRHGTAISAGRTPSHRLTLVSALARLAEDRPRVSVAVDGGDVVVDELQAASDEVLTLAASWIATSAVRSLTLV